MKRVTNLLLAVAVAAGLAGLTAPAASASGLPSSCPVPTQVGPSVSPTFDSGGTDTSMTLQLWGANCLLSGAVQPYYFVRVVNNRANGKTDVAVGLKTGDHATSSCAPAELHTWGVWHPVVPAGSGPWDSPAFQISRSPRGDFVWADIHVTYASNNSRGHTDACRAIGQIPSPPAPPGG
jgi:hypothetical protein